MKKFFILFLFFIFATQGNVFANEEIKAEASFFKTIINFLTGSSNNESKVIDRSENKNQGTEDTKLTIPTPALMPTIKSKKEDEKDIKEEKEDEKKEIEKKDIDSSAEIVAEDALIEKPLNKAQISVDDELKKLDLVQCSDEKIEFSKHLKKITFDDMPGHNGLYFKRDGSEIVDINFLLKNKGNLYESKRGANYLLINTISSGDFSYENPNDFGRILSSRGISSDITDSGDDINISVRCLKKDFEFALETIFQVISSPDFSKVESESTKNNLSITRAKILNSISEAKKDNEFLAHNLVLSKLYNDSNYGRPPITEDDINRISTEDIIQYHKDFFLNADIDFIAVADIEEDELKTQLTKILKDFKSTKKAESDEIKPSFFGIENTVFGENKDNKGDQSIIYFAHPGLPANDENYLIYEMLINYIGGRELGSVLMKKLREEMGITYGVYMNSHIMTRSYLLLGKMLTAEKDKNKIINEIKIIFDNVKKNGITQDELDVLKKKFINSIVFTAIDNLSILNSILRIQFYKRDLDYLDTINSKIESVTLEKFNALAASLLDSEKLSFTIFK